MHAMEASFETKEEMQNGLKETNSVILLTPQERIRRYGLECIGPAGDGIIFKAGHWRPGGEYVQKLIVRNVSTAVKKLKYKLPSTRYFSLAYPEVIVLSPGMFKELDVIFRPVEYNPYDDSIYIQLVEGVGSGGFHVPVRATIDKLIISTPFGLDLGYCPTHQTTAVVFQLTNAGEVDAPFRWNQADPFLIEPSEGVIPVGQSWDIKVTIFPTDASVFISAATCIVGEGVHAIIPDPVITTRLSAIGKYTYIVVSEGTINFGEVLSGTSPEATKKEIVIRNNSVVPAEFELLRHESDTDEVFEITPRSGVLPPQSELPVVVKYHALAAGCYSLDRYSFKTPGGSETLLTCMGTSMPSAIIAYKDTGKGVSLNGPMEFPEGSPANAINFCDIEIGKVETRIMYLRNGSNRAATFSIQSGGDGIFQVTPRQGVLPALVQAFPIKFTFSPPRPINYCRRVFVILGDNLPLFYDIMGTGYIRAKGEIKEQRPAPLRFAHIQAYRNRAVGGIGGMSPPELDDLCANGGNPSFFAQVGMAGTRALAVTSLQNPLTRTGEATRVAVASAHELFIDDTDGTCREVTINKTTLDFGFTAHSSSSESQTVVITNNTNGKVCVVWELPPDMGDENPLSTKSGSSSAGPRASCAFRVDPPTLEIAPGKSEKCKITFRPQQSNRNFLAELEAFVYFKNQRTFRLVNDTTLTPPWCLTVKALGHTFASGQLLATIKLTGNNVRNGKLVFPTCFEGEAIYQTFMVRNTSNLPSTFRFEWSGMNGAADTLGKTELSSNDIFSLTPMCGEVSADDFVLISARFAPPSSKKFTQLVKCIVNGDLGGRLLLEGNASVPFISFPDVKINSNKSSTMDAIGPPPQHIPRGFQGSYFLKPTHVGLSSSRQLVLKNGSRLPLRFRLNLPAEVSGIVSVSPTKGILRGNETIVVNISFAPKAPTKYVFKLRAKVFPVGGRAQRVIDARQPMGVSAPECLQSLSLFLVAPGEMGAVLFSPSRTSIPVRLVKTSETRDVFLENVSDSDLLYEIHYKEEFVGDSGSAEEPKVVSALRLMTSQSTGPSDENSIFCEAPRGILNARSRLRVVFTYQPIKAGLFEFLLFCKLKATAPETGEALMLPNEETALLRTHGSIVNFPLVSSITTRASFPRLIIEDLRIADDLLVADAEHLWRQFNLAPLNWDLSLPLTDDECKLNENASTDLSSFKKYAFDFTPAVIGSPLQTVHFKLRNSGFLTTTFHLHLPNEKTLDLEQWCDEDEPSEELNKIISIIEELKCFTITPKMATLEPGASCELTISYSHSYLKYGGVHRLPVHFKLEQGKQFQLELNGRTLPHTAPSPSTKIITDLTNREATPPTDVMLTAALGESGIRTLTAVPIGLTASECPRQRLEIFNVSCTDATYDIDLQTIDNLCDDNFGALIVRIGNPSGVIKARSSLFIDIYFFPLEAKQYEFPLMVNYSACESEAQNYGFDPLTPNLGKSKKSASLLAGDSTVQSSVVMRKASQSRRDRSSSYSLSFTVRADGFDPRQSSPPLLGTDMIGGAPGKEQLIRFPNQLASLSGDFMDFATVPQGCSTNRLLVLRNLQPSVDIEFAFDSSSFLMSEGLLRVTPSRGLIAPGEQVLLDFKFSADCRPMVIADRLKIEIREIVKMISKRRGGTTSKAMSRILSRKATVTSNEHESVIKRVTAARTAQLNSAPLGAGKQASMPTTVNARGEVVSSSFRNDKNKESSVGGGISFEQSFSNDGGMGSVGNAGSTYSQRKSVGDAESTGQRSNAGSSPDRSQTLRTPDSSSSRRSRGGDDNAVPLKGMSTTLLLRVKGQVHPLETCNLLLGRGPLLGVLDRFVLPLKPAFVPPLPLNVTSSHIEPPAFEPKTKILQFTVDLQRHSEVRAVGEEVLLDIFRSLLDSAPITEYARGCMNMPSASGAKSAEKDKAKKTIGIYFHELSKPRSSTEPESATPRSLQLLDATNRAESVESMPLLLHSAKKLSVDVFSHVAALSETRRVREAERLRQDEELEKVTKSAFAHADFVELSSEILRNTMFNLMQEAAFAEFPIFADPLKFMMKK